MNQFNQNSNQAANPALEFDPTNQADPNYDPSLHAQVEEQRQGEAQPSGDTQPAAPAEPVMEQPPVEQTANVPDRKEDLEVAGVKDAPVGDLQLSEEALLIKRKLASEPRVPMFVPLDPGEAKGAYRSVTINGYRCEVKKGKMVNLPKSIAELLMKSLDIESETLNENEYNLANADDRKRDALNVG